MYLNNYFYSAVITTNTSTQGQPVKNTTTANVLKPPSNQKSQILVQKPVSQGPPQIVTLLKTSQGMTVTVRIRVDMNCLILM